jgi:hypothetical protein
MATGIKDKVAIIGMGCTRFGERWDMGAEELMVEAFEECLADAGIEKKDIEAAWLGSCLERSTWARRHAPFHHSAAAHDTGDPGGELSAPPAPRRSGGRYTGWPPGPTTSAWPWGWKSSRTPATAACPVSGVQRRHPGLAVVAQHDGAGSFAQLASAYAAKYRFRTGPQAGHGPRVRQKPRQRPEPQGPPEQGRHRGAGHGRPHHRPPPGALRLLRGQRRGGLRHRHHAGDRQKPGQGPSFRSRPCSWR